MINNPQPDLFDAPPEHRPRRIAYKHTSREAYQAIAPVSGELDRLIINAICASMPDGIICEDIELAIGRSHQAVSGNLRHIVERGLVKDSGSKGKTASGRNAIKWILNAYDGPTDLAGSIKEGFAVIRERVANGGPGWQRKGDAK